MTSSNQQAVRKRASEMVQLKIQLRGTEDRQIDETGKNMIRKCQRLCQECVVIRQYVERRPNAELFKWAINAGLKPRVKDEVLCFARKRRKKIDSLCP